MIIQILSIISLVIIIIILIVLIYNTAHKSESFALPLATNIKSSSCSTCNLQKSEKKVDSTRDDIIDHWEFNNSLVPLNHNYLVNRIMS